jgi:hypothetical protein
LPDFHKTQISVRFGLIVRKFQDFARVRRVFV